MRESSYLKNPGDVVVGDQEKENMWVNSYKNSCKMACESAILLVMPQVPSWVTCPPDITKLLTYSSNSKELGGAEDI